MFDFRAERVIKSVDESLQRMGLEYVDLIQIHDMEFAPSMDIILHETLPALQKVFIMIHNRLVYVALFFINDHFQFTTHMLYRLITK